MNQLVHIATTLTLATSLGLFSASAWSDPHQDAAYELVDVLDFDTLMAATIDTMLELELKNQPALVPYKTVMKQFLQRHMGGASLRDEFAALYMRSFTQSELTELARFYRTPTGQKALQVTPVLMAEAGALGQQRVMDNADELKQMIQQEALRLQALQKNDERTPSP